MKDLDWGSYPFVTSSSPTAAGAAAGSGIPPRSIDRIIGVAKAYSTQVGTGPMPTELQDEMGDHLRQLGGEYGATTGRPRRVGWFDTIVTRYVAEINGCTDIAITKLDVLDSLAEIPVCTAYRYQGERDRQNYPIPCSTTNVNPSTRCYLAGSNRHEKLALCKTCHVTHVPILNA